MLGSAPSIESIHRVYRDTIAAKDAEIAAAEVAFGKERLIFCERIAALREENEQLWLVVDPTEIPNPAEAMRAKMDAIMQDAANNPLLQDGTELDIATIDWLSKRIAALKGK
jgi:uncharacterized small protein (DUF1192 family)